MMKLARWGLALLLAACGGGDATSDGGQDGSVVGDGAQSDGGNPNDANGSDTYVPPPTGCPVLPAPSGTVVMVTPAQAGMLTSIVTSAASGTSIVLADGTYALTGTLQLAKANVTLRSASNDKTKVILDASYTVNEAIAISASNVTVAHVTIRRAVDHPIHAYTTSNSDVTGIRIYGVHIEDGGEQFIKINSGNMTSWVDDGRVECSTFLMTPAGVPHVEPNPGGCYTGGIDAHGAKGWIVRLNQFKDIHCTNGSLAEHAIHFWTGSRDTLVENNVIIDCGRGIGFGLGNGGGRTYNPDPFPNVAPIGHFGGIIRNNVIWATTQYFDTGVELNQARGTKVFHNTVVSNTQGGSFFSSIDYRFANTDVEIRNNLTNKITVRDGANGTLSNNLEMTPLSLFVNPIAFDFHLQASAMQAIDTGMVVMESGLDMDAEPHTKGAPDIGADEH